MKHSNLVGLACLGMVALSPLSALAQATPAPTSSVSLYGVLDIGLTRVSNVGGQGITRVDDGVSQGSRLGFRGREDLGGGLAAIFNLEMGFATDTGVLRQGGLSFGRAAIVGLSHKQYGQITAGRQFDQMVGTLLRFHPAFTTGIYGMTPGDADRVAGGWLDNQITYLSPDFAGFKFGLQRALSEGGTSATNTGNAWSASASYANGPFNMGFATTSIQGHTVRPGTGYGVSQFLGTTLATPATAFVLPEYQATGIGASYAFGPTTLAALTTRTKYELANGASDAMKTLGVSVAHKMGELILSSGVQRAKLESSAWTTFTLGADYYLSKRTDVYLTFNSRKASGPNTRAVLVTNAPSSSDSQNALRVGIRHRF
ncbi:porin [Hydrogenophaga palleronii]|uniref:porin n=1 Tax=Hydrogenophaga palleronii TaxID=65655 RepID=UPI000825CC39|nr:porin [Hydrogenophaga palleronii]